MLPPNRGLPNSFGLYGACSTRTRPQSRAIASAMSSGMAVITPCPISQSGAYTVPMLSVPTRTQPLGEKASSWANIFSGKEPKAMPTAAAAFEIRNARREMPWKAMPSNPGCVAASLCFSRRALDRGDDLVVGAAAAEVARHVLHDLLASRVFRLGEQRGRSHDLARLAVAAMRHLLGDPRLLQRMIAVGRQPLDRSDFLSLNRRYRGDARSRRHAVHVNRARAALRHPATELGPGETELVADHPQQRGIGRLVGKRFPAVDGKRDHGVSPPGLLRML